MSINFYLNLDKRSPKKDFAIFCYIRESSQTLVLNTGQRIEQKFWDIQKQKVKKSYIGSPELNDYLERYKEKINKIIRITKTDNPFMPFEVIKRIILKEVKNKPGVDFFQVFDEFIETRKPLLSKATTTKYKSLNKHIRNFADNYKIKVSFDSLDLTFFDKLQNYFFSIEMCNNTIHKNMQFFKSFLHWAYEREYTKNKKFEDYKNIKLNETDKIALIKKDLKKIKNCTLNYRLDKARDVFFFQLYTGQRYDDIKNFKFEDVKNEVWYLRQGKTKKLMEIPLIDPALQILKKYDNKLPKIPNPKINLYLKEMGKIAGLNDIVPQTKFRGGEPEVLKKYKYECLETNTARRTFVSLASYDKVNQQVVKAYTGHSTDKMVGTYFKPNVDESRKAIENIFLN